jgi:hypothetical protein
MPELALPRGGSEVSLGDGDCAGSSPRIVSRASSEAQSNERSTLSCTRPSASIRKPVGYFGMNFEDMPFLSIHYAGIFLAFVIRSWWSRF